MCAQQHYTGKYGALSVTKDLKESYSLTCISYFNWQRKQALIMIILYSCSCSEMGAHVARAGRAGHKFQTFTGKPRQLGDRRRY
jgi:hypothetical protein